MADVPMSIKKLKVAYKFWEEEYPSVDPSQFVAALAQSDLTPEELMKFRLLNRKIRDAVDIHIKEAPDVHYDNRPAYYDRLPQHEPTMYDASGRVINYERVPIDYSDKPIPHPNVAGVSSLVQRLKTTGGRGQSGRFIVRTTDRTSKFANQPPEGVFFYKTRPRPYYLQGVSIGEEISYLGGSRMIRYRPGERRESYSENIHTYLSDGPPILNSVEQIMRGRKLPE